MPFKLKAEIRAELRDRQGKLIRRLPWRPAQSLLKQFIQCLAIQAAQANQTIKLVSGADQSVGTSPDALRVDGPAADTVKGIVIGTGTNPVAMADYKLQTQVTTNITHSVVSFAVENPDANTWRVAISRIFTNQTGASLGIREVGLYNKIGVVPAAICLDRTLYSVDVPNGVAVTLTYRITVTL